MDIDKYTAIGLNEMHWAVINQDYLLLEKLLKDKLLKDSLKTAEMLYSKKKLKDSRVFIAGDFFYPPDRLEDFPLDLNFDKGSCPIHFAAAMGDLRSIELFIQNKSNLNIKDGIGATPMHLACYYGHLEAAKMLINPKTKINDGTKTKKSLLFYDAESTALHAALASGNLELVQWLIDNGADIHLKTKFGCTAYFFAARGGNAVVIKLLADLGLNFPDQGVYGNFPLLEAVKNNNEEAVLAVLKLGSPVMEPQGHQSPLFEATRMNNLKIREILIKYGAKPFDYKDNVVSAARDNDTSYIQQYFDAKKDINFVKSGATALMMASAHGRTEAVKLLLSLGADINKNPEGTALHYALANEEYKIASILLEHNIDCSLPDENGNSVLLRLVNSKIPDRTAICKKMIALGANPHSKSKHGVSAHSFAVMTEDAELLAIFDSVSPVDAPDLSYKAPTKSLVLENLTENYNWKAVYQELWDELVPPSGNADSLQGELLRCIGKLSDEFFRNGNINWDHNKSFYLEMIAFLKSHLLDGSLADEQKLKAAFTKIAHFNVMNYEKTDSPHYLIAEAVVDWCAKHKKLIENQ